MFRLKTEYTNLINKLPNLIKWYIHNEQSIIISNEKRRYTANYKIINKYINIRKRTAALLDNLGHARKLNKLGNVKKRIFNIKNILLFIQIILLHHISNIPNIIESQVPYGKDNIVIKTISRNTNHIEQNCQVNPEEYCLNGMNLSNYKNVILQDKWCVAEWYLSYFLVSLSTYWKWHMISLPHIISQENLFYSGQLPDFEDSLFQLECKNMLIPTAEVAILGMQRGEIIPKNFAAITRCFRKESVALGKKNKWLLRCNEFQKIENFAFTYNHSKWKIFNRILMQVSTILTWFKLDYRYVLLSAEDIGKTSAFTVDVEIYLPSINAYVEISSISICNAYQSRFKQIWYKNSKDGICTINGSCLPVGRLLACLSEYYKVDDIIKRCKDFFTKNN